jgi:hypothetical protein
VKTFRDARSGGLAGTVLPVSVDYVPVTWPKPENASPTCFAFWPTPSKTRSWIAAPEQDCRSWARQAADLCLRRDRSICMGRRAKFPRRKQIISKGFPRVSVPSGSLLSAHATGLLSMELPVRDNGFCQTPRGMSALNSRNLHLPLRLSPLRLLQNWQAPCLPIVWQCMRTEGE